MTRRQRRRADAAAPPVATAPGPAAARPRYRPGRLHVGLIRAVRRRPLVVCGALVLLHLALGILTFDPTPHTGGDNGAYITLGRSLLTQGSYTELWDPATPPHTKYPPIFPMVLALAMAVGLQPWVHLKLVVLGLSAAGVAFSFFWLRARRRAALAVGVGLILAIAPGVLREGRWILSDVPFWAFTMAALWAFQRMRLRRALRLTWSSAFLVALAGTLAAYFTRSAGLPLVVAGLAWLAWRRHWPQLAIFAGTLGVPAFLWWLRGRAFGPAGYVNEFWYVDPYLPALGTIGTGDLVQRVLENVTRYVSIHLPVLLTQSTGGALTLVSAALFLLGLAGWLLRLRRPSVAELFVPLYLGLILIWPAVWSGERFLLPALPFILFYAGEAVISGVGRVAPRGSFAAAGVGTALLVVLALPGLARAVEQGTACNSRYLEGEQYPCLPSFLYDEFFDAAEVAGVALPEDAVVLNRKPRLFYVLGDGVQGINYPMSDSPDEFFAAAEAAGARYVLFDQLDAVAEIYLRPIIIRKARAFCLLRAWEGGTLLFGILPDAAAVPDLAPEDLGPDGSIAFTFCADDYWRSEEARLQYEGF